MSVWVNEQGEHNGGNSGGVVAGKCTGDAGEVGYRIDMYNPDNRAYFVVSQLGVSTSSTGYVNTVDTFINNQWSHIVAIKF
ncbi:MAG: hypothetical protein IPJ26_13900 [Bacteroidetes bacterium]|nr:hypothetical protein [Bacteroidota bacterium]